MLKEDMDYIEDCMIRLGGRSDIWQDRMIYGICKVIYDILKEMVKHERE